MHLLQGGGRTEKIQLHQNTTKSSTQQSIVQGFTRFLPLHAEPKKFNPNCFRFSRRFSYDKWIATSSCDDKQLWYTRYLYVVLPFKVEPSLTCYLYSIELIDQRLATCNAAPHSSYTHNTTHRHEACVLKQFHEEYPPPLHRQCSTPVTQPRTLHTSRHFQCQAPHARENCLRQVEAGSKTLKQEPF